MNKVIIMSEQPKWLAKILNGEKNIDIRKTMPNCELPIDVYLYCTKGTPLFRLITTRQKRALLNQIINDKVVAKFTLKWCDKRSIAGLTHSLSDFNTFLKRAGIDWYENSKEFHDYVSEKDYIYAWHIDDLVIFDKPMELSEFYKNNIPYVAENEIKHAIEINDIAALNSYKITKAPQSWQYAYVK